MSVESSFSSPRQMKYASRRFRVGQECPSSSQCIYKLQETLKKEGIFSEVKSRREYIKPGDEKRMAQYAKNKNLFNEAVRRKIAKITEINSRYES